MPSFFELQTGDAKVKGLIVSVILVLVGVTGVIYYQIVGAPTVAGDVYLMCMNPECKAVTKLSQKEYLAMVKTHQDEFLRSQGIDPEAAGAGPEGGPPGMMPGGPMGMMPGMALPWGTYACPFTCPTCGEKTCLRAKKCPECDEIFVPNPNEKYSDKCPACGFSAFEQRKKEQADEKAAKRAKKTERRNNKDD